MSQVRTCLLCGCDEMHACVTNDGPCHWSGNRICSACFKPIQKLFRLKGKNLAIVFQDLNFLISGLPLRMSVLLLALLPHSGEKLSGRKPKRPTREGRP